ncbi:MAG: L-threonylcarbamoyladenylate synthase [Candidatus Nanohaloarchaea archaeon]|nr:L-threonylcarbamoyladenylate synthase [Candidatus Nanohaloarchaea archaeon]
MAVMLDAADEDAVARAASVVQEGGTVIYPTETCYGLGCDATDPEAIEQVYDIKQRPREKGLTAIVADLAMAEEYCVLSDRERAVVEAFMPGPLTLVAEKTDAVPDTLNEALAFRVPGSEVARLLPEKAGVPVVATSANVSGAPSSYRVEEVSEEVVDAVDVVLDAGELEESASSTVISISETRVTVHRDGPVTRDKVEAVLHGS